MPSAVDPSDAVHPAPRALAALAAPDEGAAACMEIGTVPLITHRVVGYLDTPLPSYPATRLGTDTRRCPFLDALAVSQTRARVWTAYVPTCLPGTVGNGSCGCPPALLRRCAPFSAAMPRRATSPPRDAKLRKGRMHESRRPHMSTT